MLKAAKSIKVQHCVVLGDFFDMFSVSSHPKPPDRKNDLQWEVEEGIKVLDSLAAIIPGRKKFLAGNHEYRLERYLTDKAPALFSSVKFERLTRLKEKGWEYTPYRNHTSIGKLYLTHDLGKAGRSAAYSAMQDFQDNVAIGHVHRLSYTVEGSAKGKQHVGASFGWLGDPELADYMHRAKAMKDWVHGFGTAYVEDNGNVHLVPHPIVDGKVLIEGKLIS